MFRTVYHSEASNGNAKERLSFSRLETRTKEFSSRASRRVIQTPMRIERDVYDRGGFLYHFVQYRRIEHSLFGSRLST